MSKINWERDKSSRKGWQGIPISPADMPSYFPFRHKAIPENSTLLNVPYSDNDEAKKLGARWNRKAKKWYCKDCDAGEFKKWL